MQLGLLASHPDREMISNMKKARKPDGSPDHQRSPSRRTLLGLDWLNFLLADVQTGVGPFLAIYLAGYKWDEERVGLALTVGGIAGILTQTPAGALADFLRSKRALVGVAVAALAAGALLIALLPSFWPVMGALGYFVSNRSIFFFVAAFAVPTILVLLLIRPAEIDYEMARGANDGEKGGKAESVRVLFKDRPLVIFLVCAVMFHFANAAMLPLLGEMLAKGRGRSSMLFMSACVVTTQFVVTLIASWSGREAGTWGRKPLLLIAFSVLPIRGLLYTLTSSSALLVAIQIMDGVGAGIFGVVSVLVIADLTRGTGRFNLTLGAITTAVGIGAALSQVIAGSIVHHIGFRAGFLFLSGVALSALAILYLFMPETQNTRLATE